MFLNSVEVIIGDVLPLHISTPFILADTKLLCAIPYDFVIVRSYCHCTSLFCALCIFAKDSVCSGGSGQRMQFLSVRLS